MGRPKRFSMTSAATTSMAWGHRLLSTSQAVLTCASRNRSTWRWSDVTWNAAHPNKKHHLSHRKHWFPVHTYGVQRESYLRCVDNSKIGREAMAEGRPPYIINVYSPKHQTARRLRETWRQSDLRSEGGENQGGHCRPQGGPAARRPPVRHQQRRARPEWRKPARHPHPRPHPQLYTPQPQEAFDGKERRLHRTLVDRHEIRLNVVVILSCSDSFSEVNKIPSYWHLQEFICKNTL